MERNDLIAVAEEHGYGAEAAKVLFSMSPAMLQMFEWHAAKVDFYNGGDISIVGAANTRRALWSRQLLTSNGQNREARRMCRPTELGYRVIGLYKLTKGL